jgi:hypothetical protein
MTNFLAPLTTEQRFFITCIWKPFDEHQRWPIFDYVEAECDKQGFDARQVLDSLPDAPLRGVAGFVAVQQASEACCGADEMVRLSG